MRLPQPIIAPEPPDRELRGEMGEDSEEEEIPPPLLLLQLFGFCMPTFDKSHANILFTSGQSM